jgi:hypothetical protein
MCACMRDTAGGSAEGAVAEPAGPYVPSPGHSGLVLRWPRSAFIQLPGTVLLHARHRWRFSRRRRCRASRAFTLTAIQASAAFGQLADDVQLYDRHRMNPRAWRHR